MENINNDFGFSGSREIARATGVVIAQVAPPPVDYERAKKEKALEKKFGRDAFGTKIPESYFNIYPEDSQAKPRVL